MGHSESTKRAAARLIAAAFLGGPLDKGVEARVASVTNASQRAIRGLVARMIAHFGTKGRPREVRVRRFVWEDRGFQRFSSKEGFECPTVECPEDEFWPREMLPAAGAPRGWKVLPITTVGELATRLNLNANELGWLADGRGLERKVSEERLRHYRYRWIGKRDGSARLVEAPKQRLRSIQRFLLEKVLNGIPPHEAVHGFRKGRSIKTFTAPHAGREVVLKLDLRNFFPSVIAARVRAIFLTAGYPESVAEVLTGLCTNSVPAAVITEAPVEKGYYFRKLYGQAHLPQGAPTSPALANLCAFRLDCRLAGLAKAAGATYTRYADDLLFSGDPEFERSVERFYIKVCAIALEEGFEVNTRKTRVMRRSVSQRAAGLVLNEKVNIGRREFDALKAILTNCVRTGPAEENRGKVADFYSHLAGRIGHVRMVNRARGEKLLGIFEKIKWGN
ncbi:MAG TPA: reverse transcriptase family protein [Verrucomicrobiae bacterium]